MKHVPRYSRPIAAAAVTLLLAQGAFAQSPEISMRDFASGQIKKGVRSVGFGGDGATWGNYALVWKDEGAAIADYGDTSFTNGNDFTFAAAGLTLPPLWHKLGIYIVDMDENATGIHYNAKTPGFGPAATPGTGSGADHGIFTKIAMPLNDQWSAGVLLSYETSNFSAREEANPAQTANYQTAWRPSGGFGVTWQPDKQWLAGFRALLNNDMERRTDSTGTAEGLARSHEFRLGASYAPWEYGLIDVGGTRLEKWNAIAGTHSVIYRPNLGVEQGFDGNKFTLRAGLDETSPTAGASVKLEPFKLDVAYVHDMAQDRTAGLFGTTSNSFIATLTLDYGRSLPR